MTCLHYFILFFTYTVQTRLRKLNEVFGMWLLMMRLFFFKGSQKVYTNLDIDLSANISVIGFKKYKELSIISIGQNFNIGASLK